MNGLGYMSSDKNIISGRANHCMVRKMTGANCEMRWKRSRVGIRSSLYCCMTKICLWKLKDCRSEGCVKSQ